MNYTHLVCKFLNVNIEKKVLNMHNPNVNLISKYWDYEEVCDTERLRE